jgi:hypothetical protein
MQVVKNMRLSSTKFPTQKLAQSPTLFGKIRAQRGRYLLIPSHSSENRTYIPVGFFNDDVICGNANFQIPYANTYTFGIFTSIMHMAWTRAVCGRLESHYRYSVGIVYNNFPWPAFDNIDEKTIAKLKSKIEECAQAERVANLFELYQKYTSFLPVERGRK